jgi:hypothetical protein
VGSVWLLPFVKLHGTRLKLLAGALSSETANSPASAPAAATVAMQGGFGSTTPTAAPAAGTAPAAGGVGVEKGPLEQLLDRLMLVSKWCWDLDTAAKLQQELLPQLHQHIGQLADAADASSHSHSQQQQLLGELCVALQQHWRSQDAPSAGVTHTQNSSGASRTDTAAIAAAAEGTVTTHPSTAADSGGSTAHASTSKEATAALTTGLREAVVLLVDDCAAALSFCNGCGKEPLGPAIYSLAKGMLLLGR